jgi:hypothetical protein
MSLYVPLELIHWSWFRPGDVPQSDLSISGRHFDFRSFRSAADYTILIIADIFALGRYHRWSV